MNKEQEYLSALKEIEPTLSLLHYRGLVDSNANRQDVAYALSVVRSAISGKDISFPPRWKVEPVKWDGPWYSRIYKRSR